MRSELLPDVDVNWPEANDAMIVGCMVALLGILAAGVYVHLTEVAVFIMAVIGLCLAVAVGAVGLYLLGALTIWTGSALLRLYSAFRAMKYED